MSIPSPQFDDPKSSRFFFPKLRPQQNSSLVKRKIYSNHFQMEMTENFQFNEWQMKIITKNDAESFKDNLSEAEEALPEDERTQVSEIFYTNKKEIQKLLGTSFITGRTLFSIGKKNNINDQYDFNEHPQFVLLILLRNKNLDFQSFAPNEKSRKQFLRFLNVILKTRLKELNLIEHGRLKKYFDFNVFNELQQHNLEVYSGYKVSCDYYEGGWKVLIDSTSKIMSSNNLWQDFLKQDFRENETDQIENYFIDKNVVANYGNNCPYRLTGVDFSKNPLSEFPDQNIANYRDYFLKKYNQQIKYKNQFLVKAISKRFIFTEEKKREIVEQEILLVPELLKATGMSDQQKSDFRVMKDVGQYTINKPHYRYDKIQQIAQNLNGHNNDNMKIKIKTNSNKIEGYQMEYPLLEAQDKFQADDRLRLKGLYKNKDLKRWVIFYDHKHNYDKNQIIKNIQTSGKRYSIYVDYPIAEIPIPKFVTGQEIHDLLKDKAGDDYNNLQLIFFLCTKYTANKLYKEAKSFYQKKGFITQFMTSFNPRKDNMSKYSNMLLQMIQKIGGNLWTLYTKYDDVIVIGIQSVNVKSGKVAVGVAQMGKKFLYNYVEIEGLKSQDDNIHQAVSRLILKINEKHFKKYNKYPRRIFVYRSNVGPRDMSSLIDQEIFHTKKQLSLMENQPKLIYMTVTKLMNDRFAIENKGYLENPKGLIVGDNVTSLDITEFFLIAQYVNQGTATPTHYKLIYCDDEDIQLEEIYNLTYGLTFTYQNWMGPVRTPAPLQYTEKLGSQLSITDRVDLSRHLQSSLFFL